MKRSFYTLPLLFAVYFMALTANAQKQPQIQEGSVRAPAGVKIDGKLTEWSNPFANYQKNTGFLNAFNSASRVYYTVSNDDNNLYLTLRGLGNAVSKKVLAGGLTFTISHAAEKKNRLKDANNVAITFPVPLDGKTTANIMSTLNQVMDFTDDSVANRKQIDSIVTIADRLVNNAMKEIRVVGVKEIPDSVVSIYNTQGIKAAIQFIKLQPVVEIAIPLKYLGLSIDNTASFSYNIKLGAIPEVNAAPNMPVSGGAYPAPIVVVGYGSNSANPTAGYSYNPTDFWGEYTLVKK